MKLGVDYTHAVITRFNMPTPGRRGRIRNRPGWLAGRFDLFERYCLPAVAAQSTRDFHWLVYFDVATPPEFRARIEACRHTFPFTPYFTAFFPGEGWARSLRETVPPDTPWLLTTRLDSDDALAVDHVARLQAALGQVATPAKASFNITNGIVIEGGRVYAHAHSSNAFASWLEPWDAGTLTCMRINHMRMAEFGPIVQIDGPAGWLQVVHGGNISNKVRGRRVGPQIVHGRFPPEVPGTLKATSGLEIALENLVLTPLRRGRDTVVSRLRGHGRVA